MNDLLFRVAASNGSNLGGFVAEHDGYLCFINVESGRLSWSIQSGGGWTSRGGSEVTEHASGTASTAIDAERQIMAWLDATT